jgi:glutathione reductase (NADPH)
MNNYDIFIIGTGTAGETAASELAGKGYSIGIADERPYGGTCALRGCQPKKYLLIPAHGVLEGRGLTARGFTSQPVLDWSIMQQSLHGFTDPVPEGTKKGLEEMGIDCFQGHCEFISPDTVQCGDETIKAGKFIIATGARPRDLPIPGADLALTSDDFLTLEEMPKSITFIGGGYISLEFSTVAVAMGTSVTILQRGERILDRFDHDMTEILCKSLSNLGIEIRTGSNPERIEKNSEGALLITMDDGSEMVTDTVIGAIGRSANVENLGLEAAGVDFSRGGIRVDAHMQSSASHIYAVGDCVEGIQLSPISDAQARTAARNIIKPGSASHSPEVLPTVVFTWPQLAAVGMDEESAKKREGVRISTGSGAGWPNYRRLNEAHMGYKIIIDTETETILGAHLAAPHAGEMINLFALAIKNKMTIREIKELPWAYPTYGADIKYMLG